LPAVNRSSSDTLSVTVAGSGGAGALTVGNLLLDAAAKQGCYGVLTRTVGPQIRGGEAAAMIHLGTEPVDCISDQYDVFLAMDWNNIDRYAAEIPLGPDSLVIADPEHGEIPEVIAQSHALVCELPLNKLANKVKTGRINMIALGVLAELMDLSQQSVDAVLTKQLRKKGEQALQTSIEAVKLGRGAAANISKRPLPSINGAANEHWIITGNQATGLGAIRGGIRFVAAYPITPATEVLEWLSSALAKVGGRLVQAEDELASANMIIGASFGPGLSLMMESLGLAVSSEVPIVVVDVMRGGPSTGIPTKSEQSDLNLAIYGFHGDAPHLVLAPTSVSDCVFTSQWAVYLAESIQAPAIILSDQYMGQARNVIDPPAEFAFHAARNIANQPGDTYQRYGITTSGISPMAIPGTPGGQYTADGLEHNPGGLPSTKTEDHAMQLDKRQRKISEFDYGEHWADIEGEGELAIITWGSTTGTVREALKRLNLEGTVNIRLIAIRLLAPMQTAKLTAALDGTTKALVIEQNHSAQFYHYLRAHYHLPADLQRYHCPGPALLRPNEISAVISKWSQS
jgi:2-oxoglutarate ferredoxin oxidoreductase subunit alpha